MVKENPHRKSKATASLHSPDPIPNNMQTKRVFEPHSSDIRSNLSTLRLIFCLLAIHFELFLRAGSLVNAPSDGPLACCPASPRRSHGWPRARRRSGSGSQARSVPSSTIRSRSRDLAGEFLGIRNRNGAIPPLEKGFQVSVQIVVGTNNWGYSHGCGLWLKCDELGFGEA